MGLQRLAHDWVHAHTHTNTHTSGALSMTSFSTKASVRYFSWSDPEWITVVVFYVTFKRFFPQPWTLPSHVCEDHYKVEEFKEPWRSLELLFPLPSLPFSLLPLLVLYSANPSYFGLAEVPVLFPQVKDSVKLHVDIGGNSPGSQLGLSQGSLHLFSPSSSHPRLINILEPCFFFFISTAITLG